MKITVTYNGHKVIIEGFIEITIDDTMRIIAETIDKLNQCNNCTLEKPESYGK